jgi:hypothetical protein
MLPSEFTLSGDVVDLVLSGTHLGARAKRNDHGALVVPVTALGGLIALELSYDAQARVDGTWIEESDELRCRTTWHLQGHRVPN